MAKVAIGVLICLRVKATSVRASEEPNNQARMQNPMILQMATETIARPRNSPATRPTKLAMSVRGITGGLLPTDRPPLLRRLTRLTVVV